MNTKSLIINAGSSSLKFSLYEMPEKKELINGNVEKIGLEDSFVTLKLNGEKIKHNFVVKDHSDAAMVMIKELIDNKVIENINDINDIGHRILHGGEFYADSVVIDEEVLNNIVYLTKLGPLHHPGEIAVIKKMKELLPNTPNVAVFDTAFHQTMPKESYIYAVPYEWYTKYGVRKYGFHGTSHKYITSVMQEKLNKEDVNIVSCHLGSGASIACIKDGKVYDTTMGITPLDGIIMGTRSGSIDPSIITYMMQESGKTAYEVIDDLNKKSGLLGICSKSDFRDVEDLISKNDQNAMLAFKKFRNSVAHAIANYYVDLDANVDAIIFTAGIGENVESIRAAIINMLAKSLHLELDKIENSKIAKFKEKHEGIITTSNSSIPVYVIPTDEESMILNDTYELANSKKLSFKK